MTMFVGSQSFISLPSFMFVSAAVSEIHDLNQNKEEKKNSEIDNLRPFLGIKCWPNQGHPYTYNTTVLFDMYTCTSYLAGYTLAIQVVSSHYLVSFC